MDTIEIVGGVHAGTKRLQLKNVLERYGEIDICHKERDLVGWGVVVGRVVVFFFLLLGFAKSLFWQSKGLRETERNDWTVRNP